MQNQESVKQDETRKIDQFRELLAQATTEGQEAAERQHRRGKLTARERLNLLLDPDSFVEFDALAQHRSYNFGLEQRRPFGDGVITGYGTIAGRKVCVFSQDFNVFGGSLGEVFAEKVVKLMDLALKLGVPLIGINDSGGARIQEGVVSLAGYADIFHRNVQSSGVIPQISLIAGPCAGGAVYSPAMTDFILMVEGVSQMFITGPEIIKTVTGETITQEALGGANTHNSKSGVAHFAAADEEELFAQTRALLAFLPSNNLEDPPYLATADDPQRADDDLNTLIPEQSNKPYDMLDVIERLVDDGDFLEVQARFAPNIIIGFAHLGGHAVGVVANQPQHLAGTLDINASEKAARFVRTCDAFNIPLVTLVDVPGFLPGTSQEYGGIIRHGAKLLYAFSEATVPKLTVITRKAYGGAYCVMCSKHIGADLNAAWPQAEVAVMGAEAAVGLLYRRELADADDPVGAAAGYAAEYRARFANPYEVAARGYIDAVIEPSQTRSWLIKGLELCRSKRERGPERKHGNIPL